MDLMPEDLMRRVIQADLARRQISGGASVLRHPRWKRVWVEPWFNALGGLLGQALAGFPWPLRWRADQAIARGLGAKPSASAAELATRCRQAAEMARRLSDASGRWPAVLILTSHPPTVGPWEWLRFELVRQGLVLATAIQEAMPGRRFFQASAQCFLAIDPYALDTIPSWIAGLYAGFMHQIYLVWDRMSATQSWIQKHLLLRHTGYAHIAARLLRRLRYRVPIIMVLPGGLPQNARVLYAAREFIHDVRLPRGTTRRAALHEWIDVLIAPGERGLPVQTGTLSEEARAALRRILVRWGVSDAEADSFIQRFEAEFRLDVPFRRRLMRVLLGRLVKRGTPLLLIAVAHREKDSPVKISEPWGIQMRNAGEWELLRGSEPPRLLTDSDRLAMDFAQEFIV